MTDFLAGVELEKMCPNVLFQFKGVMFMELDKCLYGLPNIIDARQFDLEFLDRFFKIATDMEGVAKQGNCDLLHRKTMVQLFYEESTRTRASFAAAMIKLGGQIMFATENAKLFSSAAKGETLSDTIRVLCGYGPDVIVLRHNEDGAAEEAAMFSSVPIINAGTGKNQHPTQALLDIFTILKEVGHIDGVKIAMVGDLSNGRTVRSNSYLLGKFKGVEIDFVSPKCSMMGNDVKEYLGRHCVKFQESTDLREVAPHVDVIYQTRTQKERGSDFSRDDHSLGYFTVNKEILDLMKKDAIIMHPLPRVDEIDKEVDSDPRAAYFRQASNGLYARMALLKMILTPRA